MFTRILNLLLPILTLAIGLLARSAVAQPTVAIHKDHEPLHRTWYVDDDASGDPAPGDPSTSDPNENGSTDHPFDAIQEGIDAARVGDTVLVADGTYRGDGNRDLDYLGKAITVRSTNSAETCIIDCDGSFSYDPHRAFYFHNGEQHTAVLDGFTIINGATWRGGAIYCDEASPTIANCILRGNLAMGQGGAFACSYASPRVTNCLMEFNSAAYNFATGGAIYCSHSQLVLTNSAIVSNRAVAGGGQRLGGGLSLYESEVTATNCTFADNFSSNTGGAISCVLDCTVILKNCVLWGNEAVEGPQLDVRFTSNATASFCIIQGGEQEVYLDDSSTLSWGAGNLESDPLLTTDRIHARIVSPCINAADPAGDYLNQLDLDGEGRVIGGAVDIGADEYNDSDQDGLPEWWEWLYYDDATVAEPATDEDYDGLINHVEYLRDRNPLRAPTTLYAATDGNDAWDGLAPVWDGQHGPKATIQAAIDAAHHVEGDEVVVAPGTYTGEGNRNLNTLGKKIALRSAPGWDPCIIDCEDQDRGFRFHYGETSDTVVEGLTIVNGYSAGEGGGVYILASSPCLNNLTVTDCLARRGGGVACVFVSQPTISACTIEANRAIDSHDDMGGGVYCRASHPTLSMCAIIGNGGSLPNGGGVACDDASSPVITGCTIVGNTREGVYARDGSNPLITNSTVSNNNGAGLLFWEDCAPTIVDTIISENSGGDGGGIDLEWSSAVLIRTDIIDNYAWASGGGVYCQDGFVVAKQCTITGNVTENYGGGLCCDGASATLIGCLIADNTANRGGGIHLEHGDFDMTHSTVANNNANLWGGGLFLQSLTSASISNSIMSGNYAPNGQEMYAGANGYPFTAHFAYADVEGGQATFNTQGVPIDWGDGNIVSDPDFSDPNNSDYHLSAQSPCIDSGDPNFVPDPNDWDLDGQWRLADGDGDGDWRVDIGADEYVRLCPGDLNGDNTVSLSDLATLLANYGATGGMTYTNGDLDGDTDVDLSDLAALLAVYGTSCE